MSRCIFLLSPARCNGRRASLLFNDSATFELAIRLRTPAGATIGDVFTFMSGLYFRGKLTYARAFARPCSEAMSILVIAPGRGLLPPDTPVTIEDLLAMSDVPVDLEEPRYRRPLQRAVSTLARRLAPADRVILLGSIASDKYIQPLLGRLGDRLLFPSDFVGRGDMSRGGLLLRCATDGEELPYVAVAGAPRRGCRPPRLPRRPPAEVQREVDRV